ncbi:MAG: ROK family protein [Pedobacter sp.]|nr:ROK family protein [Pedobacter sp.]MDQ8052640.1 ROK family protein [Pedobacter sp.]
MENSQIKPDSLAIGADIGGTHITAALVNLDRKSILPNTAVREQVNSHASPEEIMEVWSKAIAAAKKEHQVDKISLALPGPFDYETGVCLIKDQDKYERLYQLNIKEMLAEKLHVDPEMLIMINDAASFIQGEVFCGAGSGFQRAIGVTLGTGLGTCVYQNRYSTNADLWCMPFRDSIAEEYLSTRWFIKRYAELTGKKVSGVRELTTLIDEDPIVQDIFDEFGTTLAEFLVQFLAIAPADVVILGGNISKSFTFFKKAFFAVRHKEFPNVVIKTATLGEKAALLGAASYWKYKGISLEN